MIYIRLPVLICILYSLLVHTAALPDGGDSVPLPGPGLTYGGIPYGSVSGNVAGYSVRNSPSIGQSLSHLANQHSNSIDFAPIEQYL